jgi:hypothetical protein
MKLTIDQVKWYLARKASEDIVGEPMAACGCLAAGTLAELYPGCSPVVAADNMHASLWVEGERGTAEFTPEVTAAAKKFDEFPEKWMSYVTRSELEEYMPELFTQEN